MTRGVPELEDAVRKAVVPSGSEVLRAKKAIRQILADGAVHGIRELQACLLEQDGIPQAGHREKLQIASPDDIDAIVTSTQPLVARNRLALAASEGLLDLIAQGVAVEVANAPSHDVANPLVGDSITIGYELGGYGSGVKIQSRLPAFTQGYRLTPGLVEEADQWFFDPDLFGADLDQLHLDRRTRRCLVEAIRAYRQGLYLATASLMGAASEGAWYAAGEQLRTFDAQLAKALDADNTVKVMTRVAEVLRQHGPLRAGVDELVSQAALLRQLRNYGVHPREGETDHLERYFSDSGAALLLIEAYTYFRRLADAVAVRIAQEDSERE